MDRKNSEWILEKAGVKKTFSKFNRQHHSLDRYGNRKNTERNGQQKSAEKDDAWCGQPSDQA